VVSEEGVPFEFRLAQNYPNPFNAATAVSFTLPEPAFARLALFDLAGRQVEEILSRRLEAGRHTAVLEAGELPSGIYILKLEAAGQTAAIKTALIK
jgi:hypothetical protein